MKKEIAKDKNLEELMALAEDLGRGYFRQGLNCTECVLRTFMDIYEVELPDEIICMATGFGGGMGHTKNTCGAITGAVLALGLLKGRKDPFGPKEEMAGRIKHLQQEIYPVFGEMIEEIEAKKFLPFSVLAVLHKVKSNSFASSSITSQLLSLSNS